jgi:hypothetical protein
MYSEKRGGDHQLGKICKRIFVVDGESDVWVALERVWGEASGVMVLTK